MSPVLPVVDCLVLGGCALHEQNEARDDGEEGHGRPLAGVVLVILKSGTLINTNVVHRCAALLP